MTHPTYAALLRLDERLAACGHHPLTPWWCDTLGRFYAHPTARSLVARVGRGGAKSHTSVKVSLAEALAGDWHIPPGERHLWAYISASKDEAGQRLTLIQRFLSDLGVPHTRNGDEIILRDRAVGWRVMAAQVGAVSGFRCIGASLDELAKWRAGLDAVNPAGEVHASVAAMMVTHPEARRLLISSPVSDRDFHAERFALGDTAEQVTAHAPSWVANPDGITEAQTRALEPIERTWRREYAAIPSAAASEAFEGIDGLVAHEVHRRPYIPGGRYCLGYDAALRSDRTAAVVAHVETRCRPQSPHLSVTVIDRVLCLKPRWLGLKKLSLDDVEQSLSELAKEFKVRELVGDIHLFDALEPRFKARGLKAVEAPMGVAAQERRASLLISKIEAGEIELLDDPDLLHELRSAQLRLSGGRWLVSAPDRRGHHDDVLDALLLAVEAAQALPPTGGDIQEHKSIRWDGSRLRVRVWFTDQAGMPAPPPEGTPRAEKARSERFRRGEFTQADIDLLGEDEVMRRLGRG